MNITKLDLDKLHPFAGHPYKVQYNEEMDVLVESIRMNGILTPLTVRPLESGEYEVISVFSGCDDPPIRLQQKKSKTVADKSIR